MAKEKKYKVKEHQLFLADPKVWKKLKSENSIDEIYQNRKKYITYFSNITKPLQALQKILFQKKIKKISFDNNPPVFILGYFRSGTTHLHYILNSDPQFASLSNYQMLFFNVALLSKSNFKRILSFFMPQTRPQDNVKINMDLPAEEEQCISTFSLCTGLHSWFFPKNLSYYQKFDLFQGISPIEKKQWQADYLFCLQNISYFKPQKKLLLKNPRNTSRVKELLELFPESKFIFIHRNPYDIYLSNRNFFIKLVSSQFLQHISLKEMDDLIIYFFKSTMQKYLNEKALIPKEHLFEISYEELISGGIDKIQEMYIALNLGNWETAKPKIVDYLTSVKNYEKNTFKEIPVEIIQKINTEWDFCFTQWGYTKMDSL